MRVAEYIADFVSRNGVDTVFMVPGGGNMYLADAFGKHKKIEYIPHHHEQAASIAAEAYGRVTENVGIALVTTGPGGTNAMTGVAGAWIDSLPLIVISGQVKRADMKGDSGVRQMGPQEVDVVSMVKPITKHAVTVTDPQSIRYHLEKAFHLARSGRRGPCWIDVPLDVQAAPIDPDALQGYETESVQTSHTDLDAAANQVAEMIAKAERPLFLVGHGVRLANAAAAFRRMAERYNLPVATTWLAMDLFPSAHPLSVGRPGTVAQRPANFAVQNADLLVIIGARLDNVTTAYNPKKFGRYAKKVMVDVDKAELNKLDDAIDLKIEADANAFIETLSRHSNLVGAQDRSAWLNQCSTWKQRFPLNNGKPFEDSGPISHFHLVQILSEEIEEDTLIVTGSSGLAVEAFYTAFRVKDGQRIFLTSGLGAMGYGLPALIGGGIAFGRKPFVAVESDGSLMMNIQELSTIAAQKLPVRIFVCNNNGYASIRTTQRNYFESRFVGTGPEAGLIIPDLCKVSEAHGIPALKVLDAKNLRSTVREVLSMPGPVLCDIHLINDEALLPKSAALPQPDGSIISMPLEDMTPLLSLEELRSNMLVPLDPASELARR